MLKDAKAVLEMLLSQAWKERFSVMRESAGRSQSGPGDAALP